MKQDIYYKIYNTGAAKQLESTFENSKFCLSVTRLEFEIETHITEYFFKEFLFIVRLFVAFLWSEQCHSTCVLFCDLADFTIVSWLILFFVVQWYVYRELIEYTTQFCIKFCHHSPSELCLLVICTALAGWLYMI